MHVPHPRLAIFHLPSRFSLNAAAHHPLCEVLPGQPTPLGRGRYSLSLISLCHVHIILTATFTECHYMLGPFPTMFNSYNTQWRNQYPHLTDEETNSLKLGHESKVKQLGRWQGHWFKPRLFLTPTPMVSNSRNEDREEAKEAGFPFYLFIYWVSA